MKLRRTLKFHSLRRGKVRQTWNKYNLYNLSKVERTIPNYIQRTFFQQKWNAKALTRAYHGEHIKERKWERMFNRRMLSVVNMDPVYMAHNDGSEQAAGRGSGKDKPSFEDVTPWHERGQVTNKRAKAGFPAKPDLDLVELEQSRDISRKETNLQQFKGQTPYMNMAYAPLERRIDVAIFRALFASSTRQARQFVVHGAVKVNGQVMTHPSYLLNPGDMFQINPEFVLLATGKKKPPPPPKVPKKSRKAAASSEEAAGEEEAEGEEAAAEGEGEGEVDEVAPEDRTPDLDALEARLAKNEAYKEGATPAEAQPNTPGNIPRVLRFLSKQAKEILEQQKGDLQVKKKRKFRNFIKMSRAALSKAGRDGGEAEVASDKTVMEEINAMLRDLSVADPTIAQKAEQSGAFTADEVAKATEGPQKEEQEDKKKPAAKARADYVMSREEVSRMNRLVKEWEDNPEDLSKPYLTPWEPRRFMGAFAFIPRYLEVNQNICAAVYLRHPVARQKYAEVPTPFPPHVMQLAFNWYLRRR
ncbi:hypothetical protein N8I77_000789 [Diaporthe amygdali]|uniref:RNA-binding S4 domain-containing protein n=1 Tax=Phomopsis amygdali TaxID=1214568 RepID=A0AAD9W9E8_PHOAM|nr:hypothetical protein N8I77_000789 [Diaporthe amygdali]